MTAKEKIKKLKSLSGSHSPSIDTILEQVPEISIQIDACFLSNPYATDLFMHYLDREIISAGKLRNLLEFYPPQNYMVSKYISQAIDVSPENIFVGNGAIEVIQAVLHNYTEKKICIMIPTFSSYYEFIKPGIDICYYKLESGNDFKTDIDDYIAFVKREKPDTIVLINPNNPNGGYITATDIKLILNELSFVKTIILDESFIHFAYEETSYEPVSCASLVEEYHNLVIVKSMSKDFGIAGLRAGYGVMHQNRVSNLLKYGYLWNVSGLTNYFFRLYADREFVKAYDSVRRKYINETTLFLQNLQKLNGVKVYPSMANFALVELRNGKSSFDFTMDMVSDSGVYVRDCSDKIGLEGQFIRVASRTWEENKIIVAAIEKASLQFA